MLKKQLFWRQYAIITFPPGQNLTRKIPMNAIEGFNIFINRFPNSPKVEEAKNYIKELAGQDLLKNHT